MASVAAPTETTYQTIRLKLLLRLPKSRFDQEAAKRLHFADVSAEEINSTMTQVDAAYAYQGMALLCIALSIVLNIILMAAIHPAFIVLMLALIAGCIALLVRAPRIARGVLSGHNTLFYADHDLQWVLITKLWSMTAIIPVIEVRKRTQPREDDEDIVFF
eukprot:TRINITY_DN13222_c0_g1_i1.p1 TRINITY_DN13222_c0_g1~~TRINITY_DN13222_c0_g1_i1.p1  ORF type:complete len:161 (+),score=23.27 TRINITY_DN13222_c0_g1_i1:50-532(+)